MYLSNLLMRFDKNSCKAFWKVSLRSNAFFFTANTTILNRNTALLTEILQFSSESWVEIFDQFSMANLQGTINSPNHKPILGIWFQIIAFILAIFSVTFFKWKVSLILLSQSGISACPSTWTSMDCTISKEDSSTVIITDGQKTSKKNG